MENKKQSGSSSSFNDLFGSKESQNTSSSSTGVFASIFQPPSKVLGRFSSNSEMKGHWQKDPGVNQEWNTKKDCPAKSGNGASSIRKDRNSIYQEGRVEPCHLSSSIYYGGQDIYSHSSSAPPYGSYPTFKKTGEEEDANGNNLQSASRGNWWEGSLYY